MCERRIAASDPQHRAATRKALDTGDRAGGNSRKASHVVGDAGAETDPLGRRRGHSERDIRVTR